MTSKETKKILATIMVAYPNFKLVNVDATANIWLDALNDFDYSLVSMALKNYIRSDESGFAPSIGQLVKQIKIISVPDHLNEISAWSLVSNAIRNSGYNSVSEFEKLPELVQMAVGSPGQLRQWALDENYNEQVASSNFMRTYRSVKESSVNNSKYSDNAKALIDNVNYGSDTAKLIQKNRELIDKKKTLIEEGQRESEEMSEKTAKLLGELMDDLRES